ncbi:hypothetical protein CPB86DRAFT_846416 [Serendipita vermifera]|nr:hypothetical protein CPB86DRAFT_846416 [Serendipita vermifera]
MPVVYNECGSEHEESFLTPYRDMLVDLFGDNQNFVERWRSLHLMCVGEGYLDLPRWIYPIIIDVLHIYMPLLSDLKIHGTIMPLEDERPQSFNFPALTSFALTGEHSLVPFSFSDMRLSRLWIKDQGSGTNLSQLGRFRGLKFLTYGTEGPQDMGQISLSPIYLPVLQELVLTGDFEPIVVTPFDAPNLKILKLMFWCDTYDRGGYREAKIYSQASTVGIFTWDKSSPMRAFFDFLLPQLTSTVDILVGREAEGILVEATKKIKKEQPNLLHSLKMVYRWDKWPYTLIYEAPKSNKPGNSKI